MFYKKKLESFLNLQEIDLPTISDNKIKNFLREFNRRESRLVINFNKKNLVSIIYYSKGNFYMFDLKNGFQVLHQQRYKFDDKKIELVVDDKKK